MVADPAKANEQAAPSAPNVTSANTVFRIESLRCLRRSDDSRLAARQKEADRLPHAENQGTLACPLCHLPAWHWRSKLVSLIQLIRGSGGIDHEKSRSRFGAVRRGGAHRRVWRCQCIRNPGKRRPHRWPVAARPAAISRAGFEGPFTGNAARREIRSGGFVSSYGNSISIPGPGIDQPAPAWALSPGGISLR